jgi:DNA-binding MarR family transcriptional regulator
MQETMQANSPEQDKVRAAIRQFVRVNRLHRQAVEAIVTAQTGLHRSQHMLLMRLSRGCIPSQKQLAEDLSVSPAAIAVSLKRLETDGYIYKDADTDDSRCNRITLTEKGRAAVAGTCTLFESIDTALANDVSDDELDMLMRVLAKVERNLQQLQDAPQAPHGKDDAL